MFNTREKLFALLKDYKCEFQSCGECPHSNVKGACGNYVFNGMADHLIANGVTIPVRCKDCKYWETGKDYEPYCNHCCCGMWDTTADDFCSYGERRNDDA